MRFSGFPRGTQYTPVPNPLLGPLLETIDDPAELKCTLRALWCLHQKRGVPRYVTEGELLSDRVLLTGLGGLGLPTSDAIRRGIRRALERGTFLSISIDRQGKAAEVYVLNDEPGRRTVQMINQGKLGTNGSHRREGSPAAPPGPKANIFTLYEENIGILTPLLAEQMVEAEQTYPWPWIEEAFRIAVGRNRRNWRYIAATLDRWASQGKDDGESGRHSEKASSAEGMVEYLRRRGRLPGS